MMLSMSPASPMRLEHVVAGMRLGNGNHLREVTVRYRSEGSALMPPAKALFDQVVVVGGNVVSWSQVDDFSMNFPWPCRPAQT